MKLSLIRSPDNPFLVYVHLRQMYNGSQLFPPLKAPLLLMMENVSPWWRCLTTDRKLCGLVSRAPSVCVELVWSHLAVRETSQMPVIQFLTTWTRLKSVYSFTAKDWRVLTASTTEYPQCVKAHLPKLKMDLIQLGAAAAGRKGNWSPPYGLLQYRTERNVGDCTNTTNGNLKG